MGRAMAAMKVKLKLKFCRNVLSINSQRNVALQSIRYSNTLANETLEQHRTSKVSNTREIRDERPSTSAPRDYKYVMPEFLPEPNWHHRDRIREKLERRDMLRRRAVVELPEFYVGSVMAVTVSDPYAPGKKNRFVGICIQRGGHGLRAHFTLRNHVDGQGVEIMYELYNPLVQSIEVIRLEKRLDEELLYLRDCAPEYSTIPFTAETIPHPPGAEVPVNEIKVPLGPRPWFARWERHNLKGVEKIDLPKRFFDRAKHPQIAQAWNQYDIMKKYRKTINPEDTKHIMDEVYDKMQEVNEVTRKRKVQQQFKKS